MFLLSIYLLWQEAPGFPLLVIITAALRVSGNTGGSHSAGRFAWAFLHWLVLVLVFVKEKHQDLGFDDFCFKWIVSKFPRAGDRLGTNSVH